MVSVSTGASTAGANRPAAPSSRGRRRRLAWVAVPVVLIVVAAAAYLGYTRVLAAPKPAAAPQTYTVRKGSITTTVSSTGTVAPLSQAKLALQGSGTVAEVNVKVGDAVMKGQALASLDTTSLALQVSQAKASLSTAQAKLATTKAGSRAEDLQAAQAQLDAAKAKLAAMQAGGRAEDVASAQASLDSARASLDQTKAPPTDADLKAAEQAVAGAQAGLQQAQASLATLKAGPAPQDVTNAQLDVQKAKLSLQSAQISRDGTCGRGPGNQCDSANASLAQAQTAVTVAENSLAKLTAPPKPGDVAAAEQAVVSAQAQLTSAQAKLTQLKSGPTASNLAAAQAAVTQAQESLVLKQKPYTEADLQAQRQAVAQAEANLAAKQTPYTDADLQSAQAAVDQAQAQLASAQYALDNATLKAPFDGVVAAVGVNVGEAPASPAITLVDPKNVRLDVTVDETDIGRVAVGQRVDITFDSIPGKTFQGKVTSVAPSATIQSGVATYLVSLSIADPGPIRPGMTGNASIVYGDQQNVLVVPNRAIRTQGRNRVVEVLVGGKPESRQVTVGLSNDQMTEITQGLAEGDQVVISATTAAQPRGVGGVGGVRGVGGPVIVGARPD